MQQLATRASKFSILYFYLWLLILKMFSTLTLGKPICQLLHLFQLFHVNINWIDTQTRSQGKRELPSYMGVEAQLTPSLYPCKPWIQVQINELSNGTPNFHRSFHPPNALQSKYDFFQWCMSSNELKWA